MQINYVSITPTPATAYPISKPPPRSPSSTTRCPLPHYQRRHINNDDLIASIDRVGLKLADCLSIAKSALDTLVQCRSPSDLDLLEAARETLGVIALPFRFINAVDTYQDALWGRFADQAGNIHPPTDQITDQLPSIVNMLHVGRCPRASLQTIQEENPNSES